MGEPGHVGDVDLRVVEVYGEPGNVLPIEMCLFHTLAPNASRVPRLMVTQRVVFESVMDALCGVESKDSAMSVGNEAAR